MVSYPPESFPRVRRLGQQGMLRKAFGKLQWKVQVKDELLDIRQIFESVRRRKSRRKLELDQLVEPDDPETFFFLTGFDGVGKGDRFGLAIARVFTGRHDLDVDSSTRIPKNLLRVLEGREIT